MSTTPTLHAFTAVTALPGAPSGGCASWPITCGGAGIPNAISCFPRSTRRSGNAADTIPWRSSKRRPRPGLLIVAHDQSYLRLYKSTMEAFDAYMGVSAKDFGALSPERPAAYFSTEYGLSECLPIYSGGLGVLSGDHLKSASDLNIPLVGVGLLYRSGYFRQQIDRDGRQIAQYPENDFATLPLELVKDEGGAPLEVLLQLPGRRLHAQIWLVAAWGGSSCICWTQTRPATPPTIARSPPGLYEADRDCRLRQEILLGMGGVQLMRALGIRPSVYHMNEGHSAFLILERIRLLMQERGCSFSEAGELVRGSSLFTTHTPVDAGNERFGLERMEPYFLPYAQSIGLPWPEFVRMGRFEGSERNVFEMTVLALNYSFRANGVSALHGYVSRHMWQEGWKGVPKAEIPIRYVTNGVHVPSYTGAPMRALLDNVLGPGWQEQSPDSSIWSKIDEIPDEGLLAVRQLQKKQLLDYLRASLPEFFKKFAIPYEKQKEMAARLTPSSLVIGFARRFAPYKRATLLFADLDRLARIVGNAERR